MFKSSIVVPEYINLLGWRPYQDASISLSPVLSQTVSGEYYQQKHPALQLDIIKSLIPANLTLDDYLTNTMTDSINEMFNDLIQYRQLKEYGKTLLNNSVLLNRYGWTNDTITNKGRFVGFQIRMLNIDGLKAVINQIGLQFSGSESFNLYLFHSSKKDPLQTIPVTTTGNGWDWLVSEIELTAFRKEIFNGGVFILGYYQDDITSNAINYTSFNWTRGVCGGCNDSHIQEWRKINNDFHVFPIYVPEGSFVVGEMFDMNRVIYDENTSFGLNLKLSTVCDLTEFLIQNKMAFKNLLAFKVVYKILQDMKFSQQINYIEENIKMMIIRDLEGDIETKLVNIPTQYNNELKAVSYNISGINSKCLPRESSSYEPQYRVL